MTVALLHHAFSLSSPTSLLTTKQSHLERGLSFHPTLSRLKPASRRFKVEAVGGTMRDAKDFTVGEDLPEDYGEWYPRKEAGERRRAGVVLHPSSLPGPFGIGDLGAEAFRFIDWLHSAGCSVWQVLPLVPPGRKGGEDGSPYAGQDANCGNTLLISLEELVKDGLLEEEELPEPMDDKYVQFKETANVKDPLIAKAAERLVLSDGKLKRELAIFRKAPEISAWIEDAALFAAIDNTLNTLTWYEWPETLKNRHLVALEEIYQTHKKFIDIFIAQQFLFQRQWQAVHQYAKSKGISIMGDMPIYVGYHSADVWANKRKFLLVKNYLRLTEEIHISWALMEAAISSVARTVIIPMQDILGLDSSARMNTPATQFGNWKWRMASSRSFDKLETEARKLKDMLSMYNRK